MASANASIIRAGASMSKNYSQWHELKQAVNDRPPIQSYHEREVWWCSIGENVGYEEDGKNELFERPILVVKKFNGELFLGVSLTTKRRDNKYYHPIKIGELPGSVMVSQLRVLSSRRLSRRLERLGKVRFADICEKLSSLVSVEKSISADFSAESPVPSGNLYSHSTKREQKRQEEEEKS